jgi:transposase
MGKNEYAYEVTQKWDKDKKKPVQTQKYLGVVVDKSKKIFETPRKNKRDERVEKEILDYGDTHIMHEIVQGTMIANTVRDVFCERYDTLMSLIFHRIANGSPFVYASNWYDGNYAKILFKNAKLSSQEISNFLKYLGREDVQRRFFRKYLPQACKDETGIIIDSTGLPNEINFPLCAWGYHNGGIEKETRLILSVGKDTKKPLYFRYVAGNINDVSTLKNTIDELEKYNVNTVFSIMDAAYCSEENMKEFFDKGISFLTRLPSGRKLYKSLISENTGGIEKRENAVIYGERGLFIKKLQIDLYGYKAWAYIVCDPERRGKEISKNLVKREKTDDYDPSNFGMMILISDLEFTSDEVVPLYYTRQSAERLFGIAKDDLGILPVRTHSEDSFRGFMFLVFLSLVFYMTIREKFNEPIESVLSVMRNLKCKIFDNSLSIIEKTARQKSLLDSIVPK